MYKDKRILALIPARGGSKGLPHKNIKELLGKPLIAWTIEQAKKSRHIDKIIVSTEDKEIVKISERYGAEVPFRRPKELAIDESPVFKTVLHAMKFFEDKKDAYDILVLLECTSPMRYKKDIDSIITLLVDNADAESIIGVVESTNDHPLWSFRLRSKYLVKFVSEASRKKDLRRQSLAKAYLPYSIYASRWDSYKRYKRFDQQRTLPYVLQKEEKVDIDDELDFYMAECMMKRYLLNKE